MSHRNMRKYFPREYVVDRNAAAAARRCGYSPRSSRELGHRLINDPLILAEIADLDREIAARAKLSSDALVAETHRIAFDLTEPAPSRVRALEMLLRITGTLVDRQEHTGRDGEPIAVALTPAERRKRLDALMGVAMARRAAVAPSGNGNGNGHHP